MPAESAAKRVYRLPTEAEWEYACRAGTTTAWFCGNDENALGRYAWYNVNAAGMPHDVGTKEANAWGLYDMLGNVDEWCFDFTTGNYYAQSPPADPNGPANGTQHVRRGGFWEPPVLCRSACRWSERTEMRNNACGFRVAYTVP
jgi:formylglycine-generating enzyme required for sulfatase activity